nr:hypothetical protein JVH1_2214 [Rhodococcus sp. JVH1]
MQDDAALVDRTIYKSKDVNQSGASTKVGRVVIMWVSTSTNLESARKSCR